MNNKRLSYLFKQYAAQQLTLAERQEWVTLLLQPENRETLSDLVSGHLGMEDIKRDEVTLDSAQVWRKILADIESEKYISEDPLPVEELLVYKSAVPRIHFLKTAWFRYAAAILLFIGITTYLFYRPADEKKISSTDSAPVQNDILPGSDKAVLTLSSGKMIELKSGSETLNDSGIEIQKTKGELIYGQTDIVAYNTMTTPRGGQYKLTLPDGSRVWLNAQSAITFPTAFKDKTREVKVAGEVYFEVKTNKEKPFVVIAGPQKITVLGTSFNINAYPDENSIKTSLLAGSVKVNEVILKPGQAYANEKIITTNTIQDIAWKNGVFNFNGITISAILRQLSRWYNVEIVYEGKVPNDQISGGIGRDLNLSQVQLVLSDLGIHTQLEKNKLIVFSH